MSSSPHFSAHDTGPKEIGRNHPERQTTACFPVRPSLFSSKISPQSTRGLSDPSRSRRAKRERSIRCCREIHPTPVSPSFRRAQDRRRCLTPRPINNSCAEKN